MSTCFNLLAKSGLLQHGTHQRKCLTIYTWWWYRQQSKNDNDNDGGFHLLSFFLCQSLFLNLNMDFLDLIPTKSHKVATIFIPLNLKSEKLSSSPFSALMSWKQLHVSRNTISSLSNRKAVSTEE